MKILYMGTPDFAILPLRALIDDGNDICAVITREDKPKGRGMKMLMTPVKEFAITENIPVYQPSTLKDGAILSLLTELRPDMIVVVAYGKILPPYILDFPKYGCINLHGSLLPKYRGSAPIQHAVLNGDRVTGVTTIRMDEGMDTGDVLMTEATEIGETETTEALFDRLSEIGAALLAKTVRAVFDGSVSPKPQDNSQATYAPPIRKENAKIDWTKSASEISNLIRGSFSWPIAYTESGIGRIKIYSAKTCECSCNASGEVLSVTKDGMAVSTGGKESILITQLQVENGKRMTPDEYFRGHAGIIGSVLG